MTAHTHTLCISCLFGYNLEPVITFYRELQSPSLYSDNISIHVLIVTILCISMQAIFNATEEFILSIDELNNEVCSAVYYCLVMLAL